MANGTHELSLYDEARRCIGRVVWREDNSAPASWVRYSYSGTGELRVAEYSDGDAIRYEYDAAHRLCIQRHGHEERRYTYDLAGNLLSTPGRPQIEYEQGNRLAWSGTERFIFNSRNHLAEVARGDSARTSYEYNSLDLLVRITGSDGFREWTADYDGLCRRIAKVVDGGRTEYFWDGDRLSAEKMPDGRLRLYVYPDPVALIPFIFIDYSNMMALPEEGWVYCVRYDQVGLPRVIEDTAGREVWRARFADPYGATEIAADTLDYNLRFPGHYLDPETELPT